MAAVTRCLQSLSGRFPGGHLPAVSQREDHHEADHDLAAAGAMDSQATQRDLDASDDAPRYWRVDESDLTNVSAEAAEARTVFARSFSKPTAEVVEHAVSKHKTSATTKKYTRPGKDAGMDRSQGR